MSSPAEEPPPTPRTPSSKSKVRPKATSSRRARPPSPSVPEPTRPTTPGFDDNENSHPQTDDEDGSIREVPANSPSPQPKSKLDLASDVEDDDDDMVEDEDDDPSMVAAQPFPTFRSSPHVHISKTSVRKQSSPALTLEEYQATRIVTHELPVPEGKPDFGRWKRRFPGLKACPKVVPIKYQSAAELVPPPTPNVRFYDPDLTVAQLAKMRSVILYAPCVFQRVKYSEEPEPTAPTKESKPKSGAPPRSSAPIRGGMEYADALIALLIYFQNGCLPCVKAGRICFRIWGFDCVSCFSKGQPCGQPRYLKGRLVYATIKHCEIVPPRFGFDVDMPERIPTDWLFPLWGHLMLGSTMDGQKVLQHCAVQCDPRGGTNFVPIDLKHPPFEPVLWRPDVRQKKLATIVHAEWLTKFGTPRSGSKRKVDTVEAATVGVDGPSPSPSSKRMKKSSAPVTDVVEDDEETDVRRALRPRVTAPDYTIPDSADEGEEEEVSILRTPGSKASTSKGKNAIRRVLSSPLASTSSSPAITLSNPTGSSPSPGITRAFLELQLSIADTTIFGNWVEENLASDPIKANSLHTAVRVFQKRAKDNLSKLGSLLNFDD